jgi:hypothetical protein
MSGISGIAAGMTGMPLLHASRGPAIDIRTVRTSAVFGNGKIDMDKDALSIPGHPMPAAGLHRTIAFVMGGFRVADHLLLRRSDTHTVPAFPD